MADSIERLFEVVGRGVGGFFDSRIAQSNAEAAAALAAEEQAKVEQLNMLERGGYLAKNALAQTPAWVFPIGVLAIGALYLMKR